MRFRPASSSTVVTAVPLVASAPSKPSSSKKKSRKSTPLGPLSPNQHVVATKSPAPSSSMKEPESHSSMKEIGSPPIKSPSLKRHKPETVTISYPSDLVDVPTQTLIENLYQNAISACPTSHQNRLDEAGSGLLSLEQVLLPAVAQEEAQALKDIQAKVQRHGEADMVQALESCRSAVYQSVVSGIDAAKEARLEREAHEAEIQRLKAEQCKLEKEQRKKQLNEEKEMRRQEKKNQRAMERAQQKAQQKKTHPKNVELWREVALLMTELTRLEKEERMWKEAQQQLVVRQEQGQKEVESKQHDMDISMEEEQEPQEEGGNKKVNEAIQGIVLSSKRIQHALGIVSHVMAESDSIRRDIYKKYKEDHQFHGYRGVKDPKGLIRALAMS